MRRAEELTVRTNQLNATGKTFSYDELNELRQSENYNCLSANWKTNSEVRKDRLGLNKHERRLLEIGNDVNVLSGCIKGSRHCSV